MADELELNLDSGRAAKDVRPKTVKVGGRSFKLPAHLSISLARNLAALLKVGKWEDALRLLLGSKAQVDRFLEVADMQHVQAFMDGLGDLYDVDAGESKPSSGGSSRTGSRSRATSKGSTTSTSRKRRSGSKPSR